MAVCQAMTGSGGWPLTIIMTPDKNCFLLAPICQRIINTVIWGCWSCSQQSLQNGSRTDDSCLIKVKKITAFLNSRAGEKNRDVVHPQQLISEALTHFAESFDPKYGGFGQSPKFPSPHNLLFLMVQKQDRPLAMAEKTLQQMYRGGIFDHVGGGFAATPPMTCGWLLTLKKDALR